MAVFDDIDWGEDAEGPDEPGHDLPEPWPWPLPKGAWLQLLPPIHVGTAGSPDDGECRKFADGTINEITEKLGHPPKVELLTQEAERSRLHNLAETAGRPPGSHPAGILDGLYHHLETEGVEATEEIGQGILLLLAVLRR